MRNHKGSLFAAFASMLGGLEDATPNTSVKRMHVGMWPQEKLLAEYELIQKKESVLSRTKRDAVIREYTRRTKS